MRQRRRRAIEAWERMAPHLGPLPDRSPGTVRRVVAFIDRVEHRSGGGSVATGMVAGAPVRIDLQGRTIDADGWACLDVTDAPLDDDPTRRALTLLSVIDECPADTPEWAVRRQL